MCFAIRPPRIFVVDEEPIIAATTVTLLHINATQPNPSKGFYIGCEDIRATKQVVLYPGDERYSLDPKTEVMPLQIFMTAVMQEHIP